MQIASAPAGETLYRRAHDAAALYVEALAEHKCGKAPPQDFVHDIAGRAIDALSPDELQALIEARGFTPTPDMQWRMNNSLDQLIAFCAAVRYADAARCTFTEDELLAIYATPRLVL